MLRSYAPQTAFPVDFHTVTHRDDSAHAPENELRPDSPVHWTRTRMGGENLPRLLARDPSQMRSRANERRHQLTGMRSEDSGAALRKRWRSLLGLTMTFLACLGFLTVADDFRHVGELLGVSSILIAGIILVIDGLQVAMFRHIALYWVSIGVLIGALAGAPSDHIAIGICSGFSVALAAASLCGHKSGQGH